MRSSSHRSSMSHRSSSRRSSLSHRSGMRHSSMHSRSTVHRSMHHTSASFNRAHRSSMNHSSTGFNRTHRSSMNHSSLSHRGIKTGKAHRSILQRNSLRKHGISKAHAFNVGRATGVNIDGSSMGAAGAAIHRSTIRRRRSPFRNGSSFKSSFSRSSTSSMKRKIHLSRSKGKRYSKNYDNVNVNDNIGNVENYFNDFYNQSQKLSWVPFIMFVSVFIFMIIMMVTVVSKF